MVKTRPAKREIASVWLYPLHHELPPLGRRQEQNQFGMHQESCVSRWGPKESKDRAWVQSEES